MPVPVCDATHKIFVTMDVKVLSELTKIAQTSGFRTPNALLTACAVELCNANGKGMNLWQSLARIANVDAPPAVSPPNKRALAERG